MRSRYVPSNVHHPVQPGQVARAVVAARGPGQGQGKCVGGDNQSAKRTKVER